MYKSKTVLEFRQRRFRQRLIVVIGFFWFLITVLIVQVLGMGADSGSFDPWLLIPMLMLLVGLNLPTWLLMKLNWRCPSCGNSFGMEFDPHICRRCGARLETPSLNNSTEQTPRRGKKPK